MIAIILLLFIVICVLVLLWDSLTLTTRDEPPVLSNKLPLIGHGHLFIGGSTKLFQTIKALSVECSKKFGVLRCYLGPTAVLYGVTDPEDCLTIANSCLQKASIYDFVKPMTGEGLLTGNVVTWKRHRKLLNPAFNQQVLNSFIGIFNSQSRRLVDTFAVKVGKIFDHEPFLRSNSLETICITSTGLNYNNQELFKEYLYSFNSFIQIMVQRITQVWLHVNFIYNLTTLKRMQDEAVNKFHQLSNSIMQNKKTEMNHYDKLDDTKMDNVKPFMELILELADKTNCFTDEEIREETNNIIAAGHDTSASVLTFVLILLGSHPQVQKKVYEEILKVIGNIDRDVDKADLSELVYIEAVLKETLRLYPVGPLVGRHIDKPIKLKNYTLKPNHDCILFIWSLHHHKMWGPDADQFRPERWLEPDTLPDLNYYYGAFGLGRRGCIGKAYAMMSMKISLVHVIRKYKVTSDITKLVLKLDLMLRPESGHRIQLELR